MNGVHDLGGMHGFGRINREEAGSPFHAPWEGRVTAMMMALIRRGAFNLDEMRRAIESIPPAQYLALTYYERWLAALRLLVVEKGLLTTAEIDALVRQFAEKPERLRRLERRDDPSLAAIILEQVRHPHQTPREGTPVTTVPRFRPGDQVVTKNRHVKEHTRLPRYARGKQGVIHRVHGIYNFPDTSAHGLGGNAQPVYSVRFAAQELWGDGAVPNHNVYIDLWESYLDPLGVMPSREGRR